MKRNSVNSLLTKNGFRVFWKTKGLATQLTLLTTLATTGLTATVLTNYNLDMSKKAILTQGNAFDFTISTNLNNDLPISINSINDNEAKLFNVPYQNHLSINNNVHNFKSQTFNDGTTTYISKASGSIWNQFVPDNNQKLVYYFATIPTPNGDNLFRIKNYNDNIFSSLTNIPLEIQSQILNKSSEIFSFSSGDNQENIGIPQVIDNQLNGDQAFDIRNVLLNSNNQPIGVPSFGSLQATGFEPKNTVTINHNVVDTAKINQNDFVLFKNKQNNYSVPNTFNIYFGDQNQYISAYSQQIKNVYSLIGLDQKSLQNNIEILLGVGDSFNQLVAQNSIDTQTKWKPVLISLNPKLLRGVDLFCYEMLINQPNQKNIFDYYYDVLKQYDNSLPTKRLDISQINLNNLVALQAEYPFLKYIQTVFWVPDYLTPNEAKDQVINASKLWFNQSHEYFNSLLKPEYPCNNWQTESSNVLKELDTLINNKTLTNNQRFEMLIDYLKIHQFYTFKNSDLINYLNTNKKELFNQLNNSDDVKYTWINFVVENLTLALQKWYSPAFFNYSWYTTEGLLNTLGLKYRKSNDFTTQMDDKGIAYTYSEINKYAKVNNVVSNNYINWDFFDSSLTINNQQIIKTVGDFKNIQNKIRVNNTYPIQQYGYQWYQQTKPYKVFEALVSQTVFDGNSSQIINIINIASQLAALNEQEIKNEGDFNTKWAPLFMKLKDVFIFKNASIQNNILVIGLGYVLGFGQGGTIPINGTVLDKSAFVALVAESYLNANQYSSSNPNGKEIYPYIDAYNKAKQLPFFDPSTEMKVSFDPTSPHWIYNNDTNRYEYFNDFFTWINSLDNKYKLFINNQNVLIVGNAISPEFLYPTQNANNLLVNPKQSPILYTNSFGYNYALNTNTNVSVSSYFAIKKDKFNERNEYYKEVLGLISPVKKLNVILGNNVTNNSSGLAYNVNDPNQPNRLLYTRANFTNIVQHGLLIASIVLSLILLVLTLVFACTLIRSIVKQNKKTFGIAMSNGIEKNKLSISMIPFALIPGIVAGVFGYLFATLLQPLILNSISSYWTLPVTYNYYVWWLFILIPVFIIGLLFLIIYLVVMWTLRKNVTELLSSSVSFRMNALIEHSKWMTKRMRPTNAFKLTYMLGNVTRFLTLIGVITTFVTLAATSVGTLNTFTTALDYTQKNKNYVFGTDLISPTIQGGWYYTIPYSQIGTTQQGIENTVSNQKDDSHVTYTQIGTLNNEVLNGKTSITDTYVTLKLWLQNNFPTYSYGKIGNIDINLPLINKFIDNSKIDLTSLKAQINTFENSDVMEFKPLSATINGSSQAINIENQQSMYIQYNGESATYSPSDFKNVWTNPYEPNLTYTSSYYPSFKLAQQFLGDLQFFKDNLFMQLTLDINFDLGAMQINPWTISKTLLPKLVISNSIHSNNTTLKRMIDFYSYLDQVAANQIQPIDKSLTYENYYQNMKVNKPDNTTNYNPINLGGIPFRLDANKQPILDENKSLIVLQKEIGGESNYVINQAIAVQKLPNIQLKPETVRLFVYMITNAQNPVYQTWLTKVAHVDTKTKGFDSTYKLAPNIVALTDSFDQSNILENTYTYIQGNIYQDSNLSISNAKIIGLNNLDNLSKSSVILYDENNKPLNHLLIHKLNDNTYPLVINEVVARLHHLKVGQTIFIDPNNDLFRYVDKANQTVDNHIYPFTVVGITTSKSEQQMYTNQAFANDILGYNSDRLGAKQSYANMKDSFGNPFVPFNGFYTNNPLSPMINNFASMYSVSGLSPINAVLKKSENNSIVYDDATTTIDINRNRLNDIVMFDLITGDKSLKDIVNKLINVFGNKEILNCLNASIFNVDAKFATNLVGSTIDTTLTNIQTIIIAALLPTLLIIICLMATMIVTESRRLIAIMKVFGIGDWKNTFNFLFIYFVVLLFGLLLAIPLTYGILALISNLTFSFFNIIINPVAPWWIYLATVGGLGIIFVVMFWVVKNKMSKINLPQAISFEN